MHNKAWYYLCDLNALAAIQYMQIPAVWQSITGLNGPRASADDDTLANLELGDIKDMGFLKEDRAIALGIDSDSMALAKENAIGNAQIIQREIRNDILSITDVYVLADRWTRYSEEERQAIGDYRQALRDLELEDPFNVVWPALPPVMAGVTGSINELF